MRCYLATCGGRFSRLEQMREKPPYLPFKTFLSALDQLGPNMPNRVEKDFFDSCSGAIRGQIIGAFRFLDLIDERGLYIGDVLKRLSLEKSIASRKSNLKPLLTSAYSDIYKLDLKRLTRSQFDSAFTEYGVSGDTKKKAKTFFLKAAAFAELDLPPQLTRRHLINASNRKKKPTGSVKAENHATRAQSIGDPVMSETIKLKGGATVTVTVKGSLLKVEEDIEKVSAVMKLLRT